MSQIGISQQGLCYGTNSVGAKKIGESLAWWQAGRAAWKRRHWSSTTMLLLYFLFYFFKCKRVKERTKGNRWENKIKLIF